MIHRIEYIIKHNAAIQKIYIAVFSFFFKFLGLFIKVDKKQVLFQSLIGKNYGDSPRVLFDEMRSDPFFEDYRFVWAFEDPSLFDITGADTVKLNSLKYFTTALRSGVWITNTNIERGLHFKPKDTIYLNTWHGCAPLKVDGNAQKNRNDYDFSDIDIFCSNSEWWDSCFEKNFKVIKEKIIRSGMPRNDTLFHVKSDDVYKLKIKYNLPLDKKIVLYAPTWRESSDGGNSRVIKPPINIKHWEESLSKEYTVLFRMHHLTNKVMNIEFNDFVRDYSGPYDINDLMKMADVLITDYSSTLADYAILERPALLFAYDYEEYYKTRGLYMRLENLLPGCVCLDEDELIEHLKNLDYVVESEKVKRLKGRFVYSKDDSTQKCINAIKEQIRA